MNSEICLYIVDGAGFPLNECLHPSFNGARMGKIARLHTLEGKIQSACAELAFLLAARDGLSRDGKSIYYHYGWNGKPVMSRAEDGFLSLSHADWVGLCAWASFPVGADVEAESRSLKGLERRLRSPEDDEADLVKLWCAKESYVKLTGEGLSRPFPGFAARDEQILSNEGTLLARFRTGILHGYRWAVCAQTDFSLKMRYLSAREAMEELGTE